MYEGIKPKVGLKIRLGVDYPVDHMGRLNLLEDEDAHGHRIYVYLEGSTDCVYISNTEGENQVGSMLKNSALVE